MPRVAQSFRDGIVSPVNQERVVKYPNQRVGLVTSALVPLFESLLTFHSILRVSFGSISQIVEHLAARLADDGK